MPSVIDCFAPSSISHVSPHFPSPPFLPLFATPRPPLFPISPPLSQPLILPNCQKSQNKFKEVVACGHILVCFVTKSLPLQPLLDRGSRACPSAVEVQGAIYKNPL